LLQKERQERMALMTDEDFEGDFLEFKKIRKFLHGALMQFFLYFLFATNFTKLLTVFSLFISTP
jgi:hypothetical protein